MASPEMVARSIGAVITYFSARVCHWAFVMSLDVWWLSPQNRAEYMRTFTQAMVATGKADYTLMMAKHPQTLSETFGDQGTSEGQLVQASVRPATALMAIGGMMMNTRGTSLVGFAFSAARGLLTPFGLLMVLDTPVLSGAGGNNRFVRLSAPVSDLEFLYTMQWVFLHFAGFLCFLGPVIFIELPLAVTELIWWPPHEGEADWPTPARMLWLALTVLRVMSALLMLRAFPFLASTWARNPNTLNAKLWRAEFCVGELGSCVMYFNALSAWVLPGHGPYTWPDIAFIALLLFEALRVYATHALFTLWLLMNWDRIDWAAECAKRVPGCGPIMRGLRKITHNDLFYLHAVQSGKPDTQEWLVKISPLPAWMFGKLVGTGAYHEPVKQLVVRADAYANFRAIDFHELDTDDLRFFGEDLRRMLSALPSASTLYFPYGDVFKMKMRRPHLRLACSEYEAEIRRIGDAAGGSLAANTQEAAEGWPDQVAVNITSVVLADPRASSLDSGRRSFMEALAVDGGAGSVALLQLLGSLLSELPCSPKTVSEAFGSSNARPPMGGAQYEVLVRGVHSAPATFLIRTLPGQELPTGWEALPHVSLAPSSAATASTAEGKKDS